LSVESTARNIMPGTINIKPLGHGKRDNSHYMEAIDSIKQVPDRYLCVFLHVVCHQDCADRVYHHASESGILSVFCKEKFNRKMVMVALEELRRGENRGKVHAAMRARAMNMRPRNWLKTYNKKYIRIMRELEEWLWAAEKTVSKNHNKYDI